MNITLVLALALIIAIGVSVIFFKLCRDLKKETKRLTSELEAQKKVSQELCFYAEQIARINGDQDKVSKQITEAKNDEEVLAIIAGLVRSNNDRVRDQAKG